MWLDDEYRMQNDMPDYVEGVPLCESSPQRFAYQAYVAD